MNVLFVYSLDEMVERFVNEVPAEK